MIGFYFFFKVDRFLLIEPYWFNIQLLTDVKSVIWMGGFILETFNLL